MIRIIDRYLVQIFVKAFLICFCSLVGLYVVIDAFSNLDEFSERAHGVVQLLATVGEYYAYKVSLFFDRLAATITTIAAMFTFSWIQRSNELMPLLSAGVPTHRVIAPVIISAVFICGLTAANQELLIPRVAKELQKSPDDDSKRSVLAHPVHDLRGILFSGQSCSRQEKKVEPASVTIQPRLAGTLLELRAREAQYVAPGDGEISGGWILRDVTPSKFECSDTVVQPLEDGNYFLHTSVTFEQVIRHQSWYEFSSTPELLGLMRQPNSSCRTEMAVLLHSRITRPLATLTLLFLCLPFVLSGTDRRMVSMVGMSLVISVVFQVFTQLCLRMGNAEYMNPMLAAWLPVLVFGTLAVSLYDLVKS